MSQKPKIPAHARREIERLTAQVEALKAELQRHQKSAVNWLFEAVDAKERIRQAMEVLSGKDGE